MAAVGSTAVGIVVGGIVWRKGYQQGFETGHLFAPPRAVPCYEAHLDTGMPNYRYQPHVHAPIADYAGRPVTLRFDSPQEVTKRKKRGGAI
jgi:hypothetical protein